MKQNDLMMMGALAVLAYAAYTRFKPAAGSKGTASIAPAPGATYSGVAPGAYLSTDDLIYNVVNGSPYGTYATTDDLINGVAYGGNLVVSPPHMDPFHQRAARAKQQAQRGGATQGKPDKPNQQSERGALNVGGMTIRTGRHRVKRQGCKTKLRQRRRGFVGKLCQTQAGYQCQQAGIGHCAGIVNRRRFAAKRKGNRLGLRAAGKIVNGIPGGEQR